MTLTIISNSGVVYTTPKFENMELNKDSDNRSCYNLYDKWHLLIGKFYPDQLTGFVVQD